MNFFIIKAGAKTGPHTETDVIIGLKEGLFTQSDLVFCEGLDKWTPLGDVLDKHHPDYCPPIPDESTTQPSRLFSYLPPYFVACVALTYATGFLTVFTFFDSIGLKGTAIDSFKAKYVYVGILVAVVPIGAISLVLAYTFMWKQRLTFKQHGDSFYVTSPFLLTLMVLVFYLLIAFARPGVFHERDVIIALFFIDILVSVVGFRSLEELGRKANLPNVSLNWLRVKCSPITKMEWERYRRYGLIVGIVLAGAIFWDHTRLFFEIFTHGGYLYLGSVFMMCVLLWRIVKRYADSSTSAQRSAVIYIAAPAIFVLFYLSIIFFGARIYPYIPARKGGGDFTTEGPAILYFSSTSKGTIPAEIVDDSLLTRLESKRVMIIEETVESIFVTPYSLRASFDWRKPGPERKPEIYCIQRNAIVSVVYRKELATKQHGWFW